MVVERFTANYVFALGISRFLSCAHWLLSLVDKNSFVRRLSFTSGPWPVMVILSEIVQTFVLADFCYYFVRAMSDGGGVVRLPAGIV